MLSYRSFAGLDTAGKSWTMASASGSRGGEGRDSEAAFGTLTAADKNRFVRVHVDLYPKPEFDWADAASALAWNLFTGPIGALSQVLVGLKGNTYRTWLVTRTMVPLQEAVRQDENGQDYVHGRKQRGGDMAGEGRMLDVEDDNGAFSDPCGSANFIRQFLTDPIGVLSGIRDEAIVEWLAAGAVAIVLPPVALYQRWLERVIFFAQYWQAGLHQLRRLRGERGARACQRRDGLGGLPEHAVHGAVACVPGHAAVAAHALDGDREPIESVGGEPLLARIEEESRKRGVVAHWGQRNHRIQDDVEKQFSLVKWRDALSELSEHGRLANLSTEFTRLKGLEITEPRLYELTASLTEGCASETPRVRELLEAHGKRARADITETVSGIVAVTMDSRLRLTGVRLLDPSIDAARWAAIEKAIVAAVNGAMQKVVTSAAEAVSRLQDSDEWNAAMDEILKRGRAT
jgi:hypothetical protein